MKAVTYLGPKRVRVTEQPEPRIEHPNDAIVRVTRTAICGSDLHLYHGLVPDTRVGTIFGHEFAGVVEEVGARRDFAPLAATAWSCRSTSPAGPASIVSEASRALATTRTRRVICSARASAIRTRPGATRADRPRYVRVPYADVGPLKIPDDMHEEDVLFLSDILPTGCQAAEMGSIEPGQTIGRVRRRARRAHDHALGLAHGAGRVIAVDQLEYRLERARGFGNAGRRSTTSSAAGPTSCRLKQMTRREAPMAVDAVGCEGQGLDARRTRRREASGW